MAKKELEKNFESRWLERQVDIQARLEKALRQERKHPRLRSHLQLIKQDSDQEWPTAA